MLEKSQLNAETNSPGNRGYRLLKIEIVLFFSDWSLDSISRRILPFYPAAPERDELRSRYSPKSAAEMLNTAGASTEPCWRLGSICILWYMPSFFYFTEHMQYRSHQWNTGLPIIAKLHEKHKIIARIFKPPHSFRVEHPTTSKHRFYGNNLSCANISDFPKYLRKNER